MRIIYGSAAGMLVGAVITAMVILHPHGDRAHAQTKPPPVMTSTSVQPQGVVRPSQVKVVHPTIEDLRRVTTQPAHIEPYERTEVYARVSGFAAKVFVDIGDDVQKDQLLAELSIPEMDQERLQKSAQVEEAAAAVGQARANIAASEALIEAANSKLNEVRAMVAQYDAEVSYRRSEHRRFAELVDAKALNQALLDEKLKQLQAAAAALIAAKASVESAAANLRVEQARRKKTEADLAHAEARQKVAQASLTQTEVWIDYSRIRAPYNGTVTQRSIDTGDLVSVTASSQSEPLFILSRVDPLRIIADIPESESSLIRDGQPAMLTVDAFKGRSFAGHIRRTTGVLDPKTRTLRIEVELETTASNLRPGMFGSLTVTLVNHPRAIVLPTSSIGYEDGNPVVWCVEEGGATKRPIKVGYSDSSRTEVLDGVKPSNSVITEFPAWNRGGESVRGSGSH